MPLTTTTSIRDGCALTMNPKPLDPTSAPSTGPAKRPVMRRFEVGPRRTQLPVRSSKAVRGPSRGTLGTQRTASSCGPAEESNSSHRGSSRATMGWNARICVRSTIANSHPSMASDGSASARARSVSVSSSGQGKRHCSRDGASRSIRRVLSVWYNSTTDWASGPSRRANVGVTQWARTRPGR